MCRLKWDSPAQEWKMRTGGVLIPCLVSVLLPKNKQREVIMRVKFWLILCYSASKLVGCYAAVVNNVTRCLHGN